ncbi:hypothetical protein [Nocardioides sp. W7]|uniref:hypothetical protein n=1 Tax=Nocardioides sp. W7 TaxID=2931390 RepID=UPI001FD5E76E|nr:hypothetical protein [Nocardioides sp. W7]
MIGRRATQHPAPGLPGVNLLSPAAFGLIAVHRLRRRFVLGGVALLTLIVAVAVVQQLRIRTAQQDVDAAAQQTRQLTASVAELKPVQTYVAGVRAQVTTAQETMSGEIFFSDVLSGVERALPAGAELDTLTVALADPAAATEEAAATTSACPGPDPFNTLVVAGCVSIAGTADSRAGVGEFVVALSRDALFVEPFITTTTVADSTQVAFSGSVGLSEKVFSGRYARLAADLFPEGDE